MSAGLMTSDILFIIAVGFLIVVIAVLAWLQFQDYVAEWKIVAVFALVFALVFFSCFVIYSRQ